MKSARDSGELQVDTLKDEIDQLRTSKDKVILRSVKCSVLLINILYPNRHNIDCENCIYGVSKNGLMCL